MRLAYLVSQYPAISHTFIQREIEFLRTLGMEIKVASINEADGDDRETFYVKKQGIFKALWALLKRSLTAPISISRAIFWVLWLGGLDLKRLLYQGFYFAEALLVGEWMKKNGLKHLHVHFANPSSNVALLVSKLFPVTYSITLHGPDEFFDVTQQRLREKLEEALFLVAISRFAKSQVMRLLPPDQWDKIELAYLGVDLLRYRRLRPLVQKAALQILSVGRLTPNKGQRILLQGFKLYLQQGGEATLHLVGDGPDRRALQQEVENLALQKQIIFHGALNQDQTLEIYAKSHIFVTASLAEGLPVVLMEAMAMEIPCIATAINGIPEIIENKTEGFLVMPGDTEGIAEALQSLSQDPLLFQKMGQAGRKRIIEQFDLRKNTTLLSQIFYKRLRDLYGA